MQQNQEKLMSAYRGKLRTDRRTNRQTDGRTDNSYLSLTCGRPINSPPNATDSEKLIIYQEYIIFKKKNSLKTIDSALSSTGKNQKQFFT